MLMTTAAYFSFTTSPKVYFLAGICLVWLTFYQSVMAQQINNLPSYSPPDYDPPNYELPDMLAVPDNVELTITEENILVPIMVSSGIIFIPVADAFPYSTQIDVMNNDQTHNYPNIEIEIISPPEQGQIRITDQNQVSIALTSLPQAPLCFSYRLRSSQRISNTASSCGYTNQAETQNDHISVTKNISKNIDILSNDHYVVPLDTLAVQLDQTNTHI